MDSSKHSRHKPVVVPIKTSSGLEIGRLYTPPARKTFSRDEERIQSMLLDDPLNDGMDDLGRLVLLFLVCMLLLIAAVIWAVT